ncbi:hypothetical protein ND860_10890 [Leptospira levettii]|uniref:hypothetical protein n=1 Tax=Leptospira levettii TaxID=2023178 RepID=UPI00223DB257|nr:hypothetical protein [Leptospira levettii]MCW7497035.1 hypothetical protein [Leptospira levettii]
MFKNTDFYYPREYNEILSDVFREFPNNFGALASPTLSKQETVTHLYDTIINQKKGIKETINILVYIIQFPLRIGFMFIRMVYINSITKVSNIPKDAIVFRTWLVPKCFNGKTLVDDYFRRLPSDLDKEGAEIVCLYSTINVEHAKKFKHIHKKKNQIVSLGIITFKSIVFLFFEYLFTALIKAKKDYYLNGVKITNYLNRSLLKDYFLLRSFEAYVEKYVCAELIKYNPKVFMYVYENQSWEKVCCMILKKKKVLLVGYQSSGFSSIFLNFFPTKKDMEQFFFPDLLFTVGENFKNYLLKHGNYSFPVEVFSALRFDYDFEGDFYIVKEPNLEILRKILYAFPVQIEQYEILLNDLIEVFGSSEIQVDLKFHPLYNLNDLKNIKYLPDNFCIVNDLDMDKLSDVYDCVIFNDNSFGIEALIHGVMAFEYNRFGNFYDERFIYFDLWNSKISFEELGELRQKISSLEFVKEYQLSLVSAYINKMYRPYNEKSLQQFMDRVGVFQS